MTRARPLYRVRIPWRGHLSTGAFQSRPVHQAAAAVTSGRVATLGHCNQIRNINIFQVVMKQGGRVAIFQKLKMIRETRSNRPFYHFLQKVCENCSPPSLIQIALECPLATAPLPSLDLIFNQQQYQTII